MKRLMFLATLVAVVAFVAVGSSAIAAGPKPPKKAPNIVDCSRFSLPQSTSATVTSDPVDPKKPLKLRTGRYASDENGVCRELNVTIQPTSSLPDGILPENQTKPADTGSLMTAASTTYFWSCDYTVQVDMGLGVKVFAGRVDQDLWWKPPYGVLVNWINPPYVDSWVLTAGKVANWQIESESAPRVSVTSWVDPATRYGPLKLTSPLKVVAAQEIPIPFGPIKWNQTALSMKVYSGPGHTCSYSASVG